MARITFEGARYPMRAGESVLDALVRGGAQVHFSCRRGTCQSCVLRSVQGDPGADARHGLSEVKRDAGYFLPCKSFPEADLRIERPKPHELFVPARLHEKQELSPDIVRLLLEPLSAFEFRAGQFVNVRARGVVRSYSIASLPDDYFLELHVRRVPGGALSGYLCDELRPDDQLEIQGPHGEATYRPETPQQPLLLLGTGSGLAPLLGVIRDALFRGHSGPIVLYHGARETSGLYLDKELRALRDHYASFSYVPCVSGPSPADCAHGRVTQVAFARHTQLAGTELFMAGNPAMVYEARYRAIQAGAERERIHADPFVTAQPYMPNDGRKMAAIPPEPELWQALQQGPGLTQILSDFYDTAFRDPRLAPFFHNVTKERAIQKQYEFLREMFARDTTFFGLRPFNAHHWMVISDELFDYRERLIEAAMRRYGLAPHLVQRWLALHEAFRREIVKGQARGLIVDGVERHLTGFSTETLTIGTLCDGCESEMPSGARGRMHQRTGKLFCEHCAARRAGNTLPPPAAPA